MQCYLVGTLEASNKGRYSQNLPVGSAASRPTGLPGQPGQPGEVSGDPVRREMFVFSKLRIKRKFKYYIYILMDILKRVFSIEVISMKCKLGCDGHTYLNFHAKKGQNCTCRLNANFGLENPNLL